MFIPTGRLMAAACIKGGEKYPQITGTVKFYQNIEGTMVEAEVCGLPDKPQGVYAFHIHAGEDCGGMHFADSDDHYNPAGQPHPYHAGDLPPLFATDGRAFMVVLSGRFTAEEIIGRTVIIHAGVDDFTTQPSGNSGEKIACGVIRAV